MTDSVRLGRILGIPVGVHWGALIVAAIFTFSLATTGLADFAPNTSLELRLAVGVGGVVVFFASILAHELGHALVALRHGIGVAGITLWLMGGVAKLDRQADSARSEFQIAIAGPAVSLGLGATFGSIAVITAEVAPNRLAVAVLAWLAGVNLILALFNLLPAAPLDGGRVLTAALWHRWDDPERARLVSGRCGLVLAGLLVSVGLYLTFSVYGPPGLFNVAVGLMVFFAAAEEIRSAVLTKRLITTTAAEVHTRHPQPVADSISVTQLEASAGAAGASTAFPVLRWDHEPIGYVVPAELDEIEVPARSWTQVAQVMHSPDQIPHIDEGTTIDALLDRWSEGGVTLAVTCTGPTMQPVGTITDRQVRPLLARPTLWGRDRDSSKPEPGPPTTEPTAQPELAELTGTVPTEPPTGSPMS